eukprot:8230249-Lingulodinium_polyedra.AAC.1
MQACGSAGASPSEQMPRRSAALAGLHVGHQATPGTSPACGRRRMRPQVRGQPTHLAGLQRSRRALRRASP